MWKQMERRWKHRTERATMIEGGASTMIRGVPRQQVWSFVVAAESSRLTSPGVVSAFVVPDTGPGVGEQQCHISRDAQGKESTTRLEVTAFEDGVFAEFRYLHQDDRRSGGAARVEDLDGGVRLTATSWLRAPGEVRPRVAEKARQEFEAYNLDYVERVRVLLESKHLLP